MLLYFIQNFIDIWLRLDEWWHGFDCQHFQLVFETCGIGCIHINSKNVSNSSLIIKSQGENEKCSIASVFSLTQTSTILAHMDNLKQGSPIITIFRREFPGAFHFHLSE